MYGAIIVIAAVLFAHNHSQIIMAPAPLDVYEGTVPYITGLIASGHNPYTFAFQPEATYPYPPLYSLLVAPLSWIFGNTLLLHRAASAAFILLSCALIAMSARRAGATRTDAAAAAVLTYGALIYYSTPLAGPNALGGFLFLSCVMAPYLLGWTNRSLWLSLACGVLAFYAKQYFLLALAIVPIYVFLSVSKIRAVFYSLAGTLLIALTLLAAHAASPYFLHNVLFIHLNVPLLARPSTSHLVDQLRIFSAVYPGLLLLAAIAAFHALWRAHDRKSLFENLPRPLLPLQAPLLDAKISYIWLCFAAATVAIVISLGRHVGNHMTYLLQLMSPFLVLGAFTASVLRGRYRALLVPILCFSFFMTYEMLPKDFHIDMRGWDRLRALIRSHEDILTDTFSVSLLVENGKHVYHGGMTDYFAFAQPRPAFLEYVLDSHQVDSILAAYNQDITSRIRSHRFDIILRNSTAIGVLGAEDLASYYTLAETVPISLTERPGGGNFIIEVWQPNENVAPESAP